MVPPTPIGRGFLRLAYRDIPELASICLPSHESSLIYRPASLRSAGVTPLRRYYVRSDSWRAVDARFRSARFRFRPFGLRGKRRSDLAGRFPSLSPDRKRPPDSRQVSLIHGRVLPDHPDSTHPVQSCHGFSTLPLSLAGFPPREERVRTSPFTSRLVIAPGRIEFVILRAGRSPPIALHLALRQRSYLRLQSGECVIGEDFHLPERAHSQAH